MQERRSVETLHGCAFAAFGVKNAVARFGTLAVCAVVSAALVAGENRLEIQVANRWMNRVIGDEHLPVDGEWDSPWGGGPTLLMKGMPDWFVQGRCPPSGRIAFSTARPWAKTSPLVPAGLEGPVELKTTSRMKAGGSL